MQRPHTQIYIATTVDGFIARNNGQMDWLAHQADGHDYGWTAFRKTIDSLIVGRKTYEQVLSMNSVWPFRGLTTVVWSRTMSTADLPQAVIDCNVEVSSLAPPELLHELGNRGLKGTWVDGGKTLQQFLSTSMIDILTITRIPILIGEGMPLFGALPADVRLEHMQTNSYGSGVVQSTYAVT